MTDTASLQPPSSTSQVEAKRFASGEVLDPKRGDSSVAATGSIVNFGTPQKGPQTDKERLAALRAFLREASGQTPAVTIEDILTPPSDEFQQK